MRLKMLLTFIICMMMFGCDSKMDAETKDVSKLKDDQAILEKLMALPKNPKIIKWEINEQLNRGDGMLIALLKYSDEHYNYIVKNSPTMAVQHNVRMPVTFYKKWIPKLLRDSIKTNKTSKDNVYELIDIVSLQPDLFKNSAGLSPYIHGRITPLGGGYVLTELNAM